MFKRQKSPTIGSLRANKQRLVIDCALCKTITYLAAQDTHLKPNVELAAMQAFFSCPECGHSNSGNGNTLQIRPEAH